MYSLMKLFLNVLPTLSVNSLYNEQVQYINNMNSKNLSYDLGVNHFLGVEFINMNHFVKNQECYNCITEVDVDVPLSVDWRKKDVVTPVKNQGGCGSCWSFSSTGSIEGINAIKNDVLVNVSEQQLIDCSTQYGNKGCEGGLMDNAFKYAINNGLCSEEDYPYEGEDNLCESNRCKKIVEIDDYADIQPNNERLLMRAVAKQPVSVAIQANLTSFRFYKSGVYQDPDCGDELDHGVLIVGYGHDLFHGLDYWIVKNSWSAKWGDEGYVKILRNYDQSPSGMCGIAMQPSIPIIN